MICPRSAILQSAAASMVEGILEVTVSTADRIATRGVPDADLNEQIDRVLNDVALHIEIGSDVDRGIGDDQRVGMARHVHDENMADAPRGAQPGRRGRDRAHQFVGVQAALHQQFAFAGADHFDALGGGGLAVLHIDKLVLADVEHCARARRL